MIEGDQDAEDSDWYTGVQYSPSQVDCQEYLSYLRHAQGLSPGLEVIKMTNYDFSKLEARELWIQMFHADAFVAEHGTDRGEALLEALCDEIEKRYGSGALDNTGAQCYRNELADNIRWVNENFENLEATARGEIPTN